MNDLRVALVQMNASKGTPSENAKKMMDLMEEASAKGANFILFPECSLTGYAPEEANSIALQIDDADILGIRSCANKLGVAVSFGFMERDMKDLDKIYISQEFYYNGSRTIYRKTHLSDKERLYMSAGDTFPVFEAFDISFGQQLCWESHIPQISYTYRKKGAQVLLFPYASGMTGDKCKENWSIHLPARASDNGCFALACNLLMNGKGGGLAMWDPKGKPAAEYFGQDEHMLICSIGGQLPRETYEKGEETMHSLSYFDRARDIF